ncbi:uncharacterized protein TNCV_3524161 [Trichonephila clavipes]|uniref:Uncharacterized protein n=1 Tax=Trichonephila clavipes TaxID=2585209 RepID=A0A8X6VHU2_TRICX|nr:uncharacterized protein TNCV_3524161 [Trichonephila clavipes]
MPNVLERVEVIFTSHYKAVRGLLATNLIISNHVQVTSMTPELPRPSPNFHTTPVATVTDWYRYRMVSGFVTSSTPVPLKTRRVGQRCTLNLSRAEASFHWCGVVIRRGGFQDRCRPRHSTMIQNYVVRRQKPSCS